MIQNIRRKSQGWRTVPAVLAVSLLLAACAADGEDGGQADENEETAADGGQTDGLPPGEYPIGHEAVTSGAAAFAGVPLAQGARLAVEEINEQEFLGEGAEIDLLEQDTGGDPSRAIPAVDRFVSEGVSGVLCCALVTADSIKPTLEDNDTPAIITSAITPGMEDPPTMFRTVILLGDSAYGQLVETLVEKEEPETAVMAVTADVDGMVVDGDFWLEALEEHGVELLDVVDTGADDTDFAGPATQIVDQDPDVVVLSMLGEGATLLVESLRNRGYDGEIITTYGISNEANYEIAGESLEGVKFPIAFSPESEYERAQEFYDSYTDAFDDSPDVFAAQGYTAVWMLAHGMRESGDGESENVAQALTELEEMDSVYGPLTFENGQAYMEQDALLLEWQADGTFEIYGDQ